jgi:hypothetical protein
MLSCRSEPRCVLTFVAHNPLCELVQMGTMTDLSTALTKESFIRTTRKPTRSNEGVANFLRARQTEVFIKMQAQFGLVDVPAAVGDFLNKLKANMQIESWCISAFGIAP